MTDKEPEMIVGVFVCQQDERNRTDADVPRKEDTRYRKRLLKRHVQVKSTLVKTENILPLLM